MKVFSLVALIFLNISFAEVYFEDDFSDGDDDGWIKSGSAGFLVTNGEYNIFAGGLRGQGLTLNGDNSGVMSQPDYSIRCILRIECGLEAGVVARYIGSDDWYYQIVFKPSSEQVILERTKLLGPTMTLDEYFLPLALNEEYFVRFQVSGDLIQGKIWQGTTEDEPCEWHMQANDSVQSNPGSFGLFAGGYGKEKVPWASLFDNVIVTSPVEQNLAQQTWASIKFLLAL